MKFTTLLALPLLALAAATPIEGPTKTLETRADQASKVIAQYQKLPSDIAATKKVLDSIPPKNKTIDFFTLEALQGDSNKIGYDIGNATTAAKGSSAFTAAQSKTISGLIKGVEPKIFALLSDFVKHKPAFDNQGVTGTVVSGLQKQRSMTQANGAAVAAKLAQPYKKQAPAVTKMIVAHFNSAIAALQK